MKYNNYHNRVGVTPAAALLVAAKATPITALISTAVSVLPMLIPFITQAFQHPARDARDVIAAVKQKIASMDARTRLATVIAASKQNFKAADVDVNELLFWYKNNYPNDFKELAADDKKYWNQYLDYYRNQFLLQRPDLQSQYLDPSYFNNTEIYYTPPGSTSATTKAGMNIFATLALVGAGIYLISKKKK